MPFLIPFLLCYHSVCLPWWPICYIPVLSPHYIGNPLRYLCNPYRLPLYLISALPLHSIPSNHSTLLLTTHSSTLVLHLSTNTYNYNRYFYINISNIFFNAYLNSEQMQYQHHYIYIYIYIYIYKC